MSEKLLENGSMEMTDDFGDDEFSIEIDAFAAHAAVFVEFHEDGCGIIAEFTSRATLEKFIKALQEAAEHAFGKMPE